MNLTCKNCVFHYDTRRRIKSWNSGSVPIAVVPILEKPVNSYDSNGVIAVPISILGDEKRNLPFFCLLVILSESSERIRAYYTSLKRYFQGASNATGYERFGEELAEDVGYYRKLTRRSRLRILVPSFLGTSVLVAFSSTLAVLLQF